MKKKVLAFVAMMMLMAGLAACGSKPEMPMELTVDGTTIVLGQTTVRDLAALGYEVKLSSVPDVARDGQEYLPFGLSMDRGAGDQIHMMVYVPWEGGTGIQAETALAATDGVIYSVTVTVTSAAKVDVAYNGMDLQAITFDYAADTWGAKEKSGANTLTYELEAQSGLIEFKAANTSGKEFASLTVRLSYDAFLKMQ